MSFLKHITTFNTYNVAMFTSSLVSIKAMTNWELLKTSNFSSIVYGVVLFLLFVVQVKILLTVVSEEYYNPKRFKASVIAMTLAFVSMVIGGYIAGGKVSTAPYYIFSIIQILYGVHFFTVATTIRVETEK